MGKTFQRMVIEIVEVGKSDMIQTSGGGIFQSAPKIFTGKGEAGSPDVFSK